MRLAKTERSYGHFWKTRKYLAVSLLAGAYKKSAGAFEMKAPAVFCDKLFKISR